MIFLYTDTAAPLVHGPFRTLQHAIEHHAFGFPGVHCWWEEHRRNGWHYQNVIYLEDGHWRVTSQGVRPIPPERPEALAGVSTALLAPRPARRREGSET